MKGPLWTNERTELLIKLWSVDGLSASQCAPALGITRNAVIGKVHRLKLPARRPKSTKRASPAPKPRKHYLSVRRRVALKMPLTDPPKLKAAKPEPKRPDQPAWQALPGSKPVPLADLEAGMCKWPIGDDRPYLFCGCAATNGHYCLEHYQWSIGRGTPSEQTAPRAAHVVARLERSYGFRSSQAGQSL